MTVAASRTQQMPSAAPSRRSANSTVLRQRRGEGSTAGAAQGPLELTSFPNSRRFPGIIRLAILLGGAGLAWVVVVAAVGYAFQR